MRLVRVGKLSFSRARNNERPRVAMLLEGKGRHHAAQPAERTSACSSTVRVADSCLSGG